MSNLDLSKRVVCAANRDASGHIVCGARHHDIVMAMQIQNSISYSLPWEQGFINTWGEFLTRREAWQVAVHNNQIIRRVGNDEGVLYSENLY